MSLNMLMKMIASKNLSAEVPPRIRDDLLDPSQHVHGRVPWVHVPDEFRWLSRNSIV